MIALFESRFLMAKAASLGIAGEMLMMFSATSLIESTNAENSTLLGSGAESCIGVTVALKYGCVERYSPTSIFSNPESITVRFPLGISNILSMRAEVPTLCISPG